VALRLQQVGLAYLLKIFAMIVGGLCLVVALIFKS